MSLNGKEMNGANTAPFLMILVLFESWDRELSNGTKIAANGTILTTFETIFCSYYHSTTCSFNEVIGHRMYPKHYSKQLTLFSSAKILSPRLRLKTVMNNF